MNPDFIAQRQKFMAATLARFHVSEEAFAAVTELLAPLAVPFRARKGEYLQRAGQPALTVFWISSGVVRCGFLNREGAAVTLRFFMAGEGAAAQTDLLAGESGVPAVQFLVAETPIEGFYLDWQQPCQLRARHEVLRHYHLGVTEYGLQRQVQHAYSHGETSASERLAAFRAEYPGLERQISQRAMASYLGITPQYMSRLLREHALTA